MPPSNANQKSKPRAAQKAWSGRFTKGPDPRAEAYTHSVRLDIRLLPYDLLGSMAHATMLGEQGILTQSETRALLAGLKSIQTEWQAGTLRPESGDEDVHMLVERLLYAKLGAVAGKLHTARSRNDQVITDFKLYLRAQTERVQSALHELGTVWVQLARQTAAAKVIFPGYTHLQVAQPVYFAHWCMAHFQAFRRDAMRFATLLQGDLAECPLGSAALAGTSHPINRARTAELLGFARLAPNSMDAVGQRDFALEWLSAAALCAVHMGRLAEELVVYSSAEFRFLTLDQAFATGSSIMPQKRNPDVAELMRGRTGKMLGNWVNLATVLKGLPLAYNRDLQEDKEPVFASVDTLIAGLEILAPMLQSMTIHPQRMAQACQQGYPTATEAADHLVRQGVPFREAHEVVGKMVTWAQEQGRSLEQLRLEEWQQHDPRFTAGIMEAVTLEAAVNGKRSEGGTALTEVMQQIKDAEKWLKSEQKTKK